jgi:predicted transcriptional regulator
MARPPGERPTDAELEILLVLWERGPSELGAIHAALGTQRSVALTTVATTLTVMLGKDLVKRKRGPRGYIWSARLSRDDAAQGIIRRLVDRVFDGSAQHLVAHLLEHEKFSEADRREIRELLDAARRPRKSNSPGAQP